MFKMAKKENTYSIIQNFTSKIALLTLFIVCNVSLYANSGQAFEKATYSFEGCGKNEVAGFQTFDSDNLVIDAIVKPRSVKKRRSIAEQTDGQNGYRLIQEGRNVVFEIAIDGSIHNITATDVFKKGESVYLSAYYKDGCAGVLVNGKKPVMNIFQIDGEQLIRLQNTGINPTIINQLSTLEEDAFYVLSDFQKVLRKQLGRRAFKKYGDEIIQLAHINIEQANATCYVGRAISLAEVPMSIGLDFSGTIEQVRIWQPMDVRSLVVDVPEEKGRTELKVNEACMAKLQKVSPMQKVTLPLSNSLPDCYNCREEKVATVSKTITTPNALAGNRIVNQQNYHAGIDLDSIDKVLKASSLLSNTCTLIAEWNSSVSIKGFSELEVNSFRIPSLCSQQEMVDQDDDSQISMFTALNELRPFIGEVKGRDFEELNYDKYRCEFDAQNYLGSHPTDRSSLITIKREDYSKIDLCRIHKLASEKKGDFFEGDVCKMDDELFVYISLCGAHDRQARSVSTGQSSQKCESQKLSPLVMDAKSEWLTVIIENYKKGQESNKTKKTFEICSPDAVGYVNNISGALSLCCVMSQEKIIRDIIWNATNKNQNRRCQVLGAESGFRNFEESSLVCDYHKVGDRNGLFWKNRSWGCKLDNDILMWSQSPIDHENGEFSFSEEQELKQLIKICGPSVQLIETCICASLVSCRGDGLVDNGGRVGCGVRRRETNNFLDLRSSELSLSKCKTVVPAATFEITKRWAGHKLARSYLINEDSKFMSAIDPSPLPKGRQRCSTRHVNDEHDVGWLDWYAHSYLIFNPPERSVQLGLYAMC